MTKRELAAEGERPIAEDELEEWEVVEPEERKPLSAVLTVRFSPEEMRRVRDAAKAANVSMGDIVRRGVQAYLKGASAPVTTTGYATSWPGVEVVNLLSRAKIATFGQGQAVEREDSSDQLVG
jgi:hypothetical protein